MTCFVSVPDIIDREPVAVMSASCSDELDEIQKLWPRFEELVGLRGRKMYAAVDPLNGTYTTCTPIRDGDDPEAVGLEVRELAGGRFRRGRLRGEPPALYGFIGSAMTELEAASDVDVTRPLVEFYKRHDEIELWVPIR